MSKAADQLRDLAKQIDDVAARHFAYPTARDIVRRCLAALRADATRIETEERLDQLESEMRRLGYETRRERVAREEIAKRIDSAETAADVPEPTQDDAVAELVAMCSRFGQKSKFCSEHNIWPAELTKVLNYEQKPPDKIMRALGYIRIDPTPEEAVALIREKVVELKSASAVAKRYVYAAGTISRILSGKVRPPRLLVKRLGLKTKWKRVGPPPNYTIEVMRPDAEIVAALRGLCVKHGDQTRLGLKAGVPASTINAILNERMHPTLEVARALGMTSECDARTLPTPIPGEKRKPPAKTARARKLAGELL